MALVERLLSDFIRSLTSEQRGQLPRWERGIRALRVYFDGQPQPARHETALRDLVRDTDSDTVPKRMSPGSRSSTSRIRFNDGSGSSRSPFDRGDSDRLRPHSLLCRFARLFSCLRSLRHPGAFFLAYRSVFC